MSEPEQDQVTPSEFNGIKSQLNADDIITVAFENTDIDDQSRNPLTQRIRVTQTSDNWIRGEDPDNPSRNRGLGIRCGAYAGTQQVMFVYTNSVRGMRDNHTKGPVVDISF